MVKNHPAPRLRDLPLWRLLVALADAERAFGPAHETTHRYAALVQERLTTERAPSKKGVPSER